MPSLLALAVLLAGNDPGAHSRAVLDTARLAVQGDSAPAVAARWEGRLRRAPDDRAARLGLASLARLTYADSVAERHLAALTADATRPDPWAVYARLEWSELLDRQNHVAEAGAETERARAAARRIGDRRMEGAALVRGVFFRVNLVGIASALGALDTAARLLPPEAVAEHAERLWRLAVLYAATGDPRGRAVADSARALARRTGDAALEGQAARARGQVHHLRAEYDSALVYYGLAERAMARARDRSARSMVLVRAAASLLSEGRLGEMRERLDEALVEARASRNVFVESSTHTALGALARTVGDPALARRHLLDARRLFAEQASETDVALVDAQLSQVALQAGDLAEARRRAEAALLVIERMGDKAELVETMRVLARVATRRQQWDEAAAWHDSIRAMARTGPAMWGHGLEGDEGRTALARGDLATAERLLLRYVSRIDSTEHLRLYDTRVRLAELWARQGKLERAAAELRHAGEELDRWRATLDDRELRVLAFQTSYVDRDDLRSSLTRTIALLVRGGREADAYAIAEHRRARELAESLARAAALRQGSAPDGAGRVGAAAPAPLPERLDPATAILEFVAGRDDAPSTLFVFARGGLRAHLLPPEDSVASEVARLVSLLESGAQPGALARGLGATLLDDALGELPAAITRLVVVPDGALHRLPFDALRLADGRYLAERYAVSIAPSIGVLALLRARADIDGGDRGRDDGVRLLAFGDPAFAGERAAGTTSPYRDAFAESGGLPRLVASGREARMVARYADESDVRLRGDATAEHLRSERLGRYDIVHFATHAIVDDRAAARTALALAPSLESDGFLGIGELAALRLGADLVVLSACRSAGGVVVGGEGVQGLTAPLLQAGARSVVATQWRIRDRGTVAFVEDFYDAMAGGRTVGDALRDAKLAAIRRGAPPGEWAAFTLVGDPLVRLPLRRPPPAVPWLAVALTLVLGVAAAGAVRYSSRTRSARAAERRSVASAA